MAVVTPLEQANNLLMVIIMMYPMNYLVMIRVKEGGRRYVERDWLRCHISVIFNASHFMFAILIYFKQVDEDIAEEDANEGQSVTVAASSPSFEDLQSYLDAGRGLLNNKKFEESLKTFAEGLELVLASSSSRNIYCFGINFALGIVQCIIRSARDQDRDPTLEELSYCRVLLENYIHDGMSNKADRMSREILGYVCKIQMKLVPMSGAALPFMIQTLSLMTTCIEKYLESDPLLGEISPEKRERLALAITEAKERVDAIAVAARLDLDEREKQDCGNSPVKVCLRLANMPHFFDIHYHLTSYFMSHDVILFYSNRWIEMPRWKIHIQPIT